MKRWLRVFAALLLLGFFVYGCFQWSGHGLRASVEETRRQLRQQGFRTELSDFDFRRPGAVEARADEIIAAAQAVASSRIISEFQLMESVGTNLALAISPIETIATDSATNLWPLLRQEFSPHDKMLDHVCASLMAGPVRFQPQMSGDIKLPHLAHYKKLAQTLAVRAVLAMHERNTNGVFTNLLALSRMVTAWKPEPTDPSHLVWFAGVDIVEKALWEFMQTDYPNEPQLAALQREWESVRLFDGLPEAAELNGANMIRICRNSREESYSQQIGGWGPIYKSLFTSPTTGFPYLWASLKGFRQHARYRNQGSYEDEKALLLYFRDRNQELKKAIACTTWAEMRFLPGVTNTVRFQSPNASRLVSMMNLKQLSLNTLAGQRSLPARAVETETKRRLIVTALALERFALRHKEYPSSLADLVPDYLPSVPLDFMDGQPLRYFRSVEKRYLLYSVGLDCVDNGGQMATIGPRNRSRFARSTEGDIVWPQPANQTEVDLFERQIQSEPTSFRNNRRGL